MADRQSSRLPQHLSGSSTYQGSAYASGNDRVEAHNSSRRYRTHLQDPNSRGQETHPSERESYIFRQGTNTTRQQTYPAASGVYTADRDVVANVQRRNNVVPFNAHLNSESGSQFIGHIGSEFRDTGLQYGLDRRADSYTPGGYHTAGHQVGNNNYSTVPQPQSQAPSQILDPIGSSNTIGSYHGVSAISSSGPINFAASEPWASANQNPFAFPMQAPSYESAINGQAYEQHTSLQMVSVNSASPSPSRDRMLSLHRYSNNNFGLSAAPSRTYSTLRYGREGWDETVNLPTRRARHGTPAAAFLSVDYGQGRSDKLDLAIGQSDHGTTSQNCHKLPRQDLHPYTQPASDTGDLHVKISRALDRQPSTKTSVTTTTLDSQGSRKAESALRISLNPDPLPCRDPNCSNTYRGRDRITNMQRHFRERHGENEWPRCPWCGKEFTRKFNLERHQKSCKSDLS